MEHLFNPENRFWGFMSKIMDVFVISVLWFLFSIPVVTIGAATTSLYQFTLKQTEDEEGYVWKSFAKAFIKNFLQATALWLIILASGVFLMLDLYACLNISMPVIARIICFGVLLCIVLLYLLTSIYVFPILSRFRHPVKDILLHSFIMSVGNLYISVTILVIYAAAGVLTYFLPLLLPVFMGLAAFFSSYLLRYVFSRYQCD